MSETITSEPDSSVESHPFQAEVAELLRLMVHAVYSETDVFLRELVSNASDACDRLRYEAIAKPDLLADEPRLAIRIVPDKEAGTLTIADNGVGMDRQELIDNLGTVARSGTRAFMQRLAEAKDGAALIGQFGVGFYSAFMVADRITVTSRRAGAGETWTWRSSGGAGFDIAPASEADAARVARGTEIVLHLKDEAKHYLEPGDIERVVHTYSDHISFPIELVAADDTARQINSAAALWQRPKSEVVADDYKQAYRALAGAFDEPALTLHYRAEGRQSYAVLLFVPTMRPFDLFDPGRAGHVKLYVRRVFITADAALLPTYLRFVRGVVDSEDLPLNISREMLQNNPQVAQMRKALTSRLLGELESLADKDADAYGKVWEAFGRVLKEGLYEDPERRDELLVLARFPSSKGEGVRSLAQYVADLRPNQTEIYYLVGDSIERLRSNPKLEAARARGIEVLLMTDPIDALWTALPLGFDGKPLKSLSQGEVDLGLVPLVETAEKEPDQTADAIDEAIVITAAKAALGEEVADVRASSRLTDSPACLVAESHGPDRELARLLSRQERLPGSKPILELNMRHSLVKALGRAAAGSDEAADLAMLLFEQAQILDGELPSDPAAFTARLNRMVVRGLA